MMSRRDLEGGNGGLFQVVSWYDETIETLITVVDCDILQHSTAGQCRYQQPRRSAAARLLRSRVRIPPGAWMFDCCECCVVR